MVSTQISPRVVLSVVVILIGILMLWKNWNGKLTEGSVLTAIALIIIGSHLSWIEIDESDDL